MGLFSKIFKSIKKVVKGVAKVIKKTVKGVAKVVKKVAKSKIFKAVLVAAGAYVLGGSAIGAFGGATEGSFFGQWAKGASTLVKGEGAIGALGKIYKPFEMLGTGLGKGARAITDFTGITEPNLLDASKSFPIGDPANYDPNIATGATDPSYFPIGDPANYDPNIATGATDVSTDAVVDNVTKGSGWSDFGKTVGTSVATNVATGYVMSKLTEEDPTGQMSGLALEGKGQLDPFAVYYGDGKPLSIADAYGQLLYGTGDPITNGGNTTNLYTQDIEPVAA
jgi:hypothetical protein